MEYYGIMNLYNVFDSLEEAKIAQEEDFGLLKSTHDYDPGSKYWMETLRWADIMRRIDGKYVYPAMKGGKVNNQEFYEEGWFDREDI